MMSLAQYGENLNYIQYTQDLERVFIELPVIRDKRIVTTSSASNGTIEILITCVCLKIHITLAAFITLQSKMLQHLTQSQNQYSQLLPPPLQPINGEM